MPTDDPGSRRRRWLARRRLRREKFVTLVVLVLALAVTLVLLGLQWLDNDPAVTSAGVLANLTVPGGMT